MTLSTRVKRYYASAPAGEVMRETVSLYHPQFSQDWHLTSDSVGFSADLGDGSVVTFTPAPFKVKLPPRDGSSAQSLTFSLANLGESIMAELAAMTADMATDIRLEFRGYLDTGASATPDEGPLVLSLREIEVTPTQINGNATSVPLFATSVPRLTYTRQAFPGLSR